MLESRTAGALQTAWQVLRAALRARPLAAAAVLGLGALQTGCSAISATMECRDAARAVEHGVASGPRGIYQLTLARAYLQKAREEAAEAHYGSAVSLARAAQRATERARDGAGGSSSAQGQAE